MILNSNPTIKVMARMQNAETILSQEVMESARDS